MSCVGCDQLLMRMVQVCSSISPIIHKTYYTSQREIWQDISQLTSVISALFLEAHPWFIFPLTNDRIVTFLHQLN